MESLLRCSGAKKELLQIMQTLCGEYNQDGMPILLYQLLDYLGDKGQEMLLGKQCDLEKIFTEVMIHHHKMILFNEKDGKRYRYNDQAYKSITELRKAIDRELNKLIDE